MMRQVIMASVCSLPPQGNLRQWGVHPMPWTWALKQRRERSPPPHSRNCADRETNQRGNPLGLRKRLPVQFK
jgi:hypothetical protein